MTTERVNQLEEQLANCEAQRVNSNANFYYALFASAYGRELLEEVKRLRIVSGEEFHEGKIVFH